MGMIGLVDVAVARRTLGISYVLNVRLHISKWSIECQPWVWRRVVERVWRPRRQARALVPNQQPPANEAQTDKSADEQCAANDGTQRRLGVHKVLLRLFSRSIEHSRSACECRYARESFGEHNRSTCALLAEPLNVLHPLANVKRERTV